MFGPRFSRFSGFLHRYTSTLDFTPAVPDFVPAELPARYAIKFIPAVSEFTPAVSVPPAVVASPVSHVTTVSAPAPASVTATEYSIVSSANFVFPSSTPCIGTTK